MTSPAARPRGAAVLMAAAAVAVVAAVVVALLVNGAPGADDEARATPEATVLAEPAEVERAVLAGATTIDVRTPQEYAAGHLAGAIDLDVTAPGFDAALTALDPAAPYVVYCVSGRRAGIAIDRMRALGFTDLVNAGRFDALATRTSLPLA